MDGVARTPLTVDCRAPGFVAALHKENPPPAWFQLGAEQRQPAGSPWGPRNPQARNRYSDVQNNPLRYTDPSGHRLNPFEEGGRGELGPLPPMDPAWVAESAAAAIYFVAVVTTGAVVVGGTVTMADAKGEKKPNEPTDPVPQKAKDVADYASKHGGAAQQGYVGNRPFQNDGRGEGEVLPQTDSDGKPITYKEYDVNPYTPGVNRGAERVVIGSDGSKYYTDDHYKTFKKF